MSKESNLVNELLDKGITDNARIKEILQQKGLNSEYDVAAAKYRKFKRGKKNVDNKPGLTKKVTENGVTTSEIEGVKEVPHDNESLMKLHGYDPDKFDLINSKSSQWDTQLKGGHVETLYATKITVKPKENYVDHDEISRIASKYKPKILREKTYRAYDEYMILEMQIPDLHLGKLAWEGETGENYDSKIAEKRFKDATEYFIGELSCKKFYPKKIIVPFGEDYLHVDNNKNETTSGTPQDVDTRSNKVFEIGFKLMVWQIENLREYTECVEVPLVIGNHSETSVFHMAIALNAYFRNYDDVIIDISVKKRKYLQFGSCMLCLGHLAKENKKNIPGLPMKEQPVMYGKTKHREFHSGHFHSESVVEENGIKFRRLPSLSGTDNWHADSGYKSQKAAMCFVWDEDNGVQETWYYYPEV